MFKRWTKRQSVEGMNEPCSLVTELAEAETEDHGLALLSVNGGDAELMRYKGKWRVEGKKIRN